MPNRWMTMAANFKNETQSVKKRRSSGQATIELALSLPFLIWLIAYTFNAYYMMHTSHVGQKYAAMNLYKRLNNRAQFVMDDVDGGAPHNKQFMAVRYVDGSGDIPKRRIMFAPREIDNIVGICREPGCQ